MSKIICDVCGTRYPDTTEQCPICGHIRENAEKTAKHVPVPVEVQPETRKKVQGGRFSKENVRKRNEGKLEYEEVPVKKSKPAKAAENEMPVKTAKPAKAAKPAKQDEDIFTEDDQNKRANRVLNILLVIVILALLAVTAYIFTQFIMPEINKPEPTTPPTIMQTEPTQPQETEPPSYACTELVLEETEVLLTEYEQKWLIPVTPMPVDTTDELTFTSGNELIVTVDSEGCLTALAEGQTTVTITCGNVTVDYNVICLFPGADIPPGYVPTDPPPTEPPVEYKVTSNYVHVRTGPEVGMDPVRQCMKGESIWVYEIKYDKTGLPWGKLEDGWLCVKYAQKVE
ncbi:MAG: Ig-like domain-containing protein [Oscillospiraceae bacterium]|nr:Ig-like domain-containing protein [Oscillospiraceae bacterium]